jgi:phosphoenolpyruvate-protein phosphotransferase
MRRLRGIGASPGVVRAPWVRLDLAAGPIGGRTTADRAAGEVERLEAATLAAASDLEALSLEVRHAGHPDEAAIFEAQAAIAADPALAAMAVERIERSNDDAIAAIRAAAESFAEQLRALEDELLAARAADVVDVGDRIARRLAGTPEPSLELDAPSIVVAEDLPPSLAATLARERLAGIALQGSSPTAHAAILARAYGIPAVVGVVGLLDALGSRGPEGTGEIGLDGGSGEIFTDLDVSTRGRIDALAEEGRERHELDLVEAMRPAVTLDGTEVALLANIGSPDESAAAIALGAAGVGLFRTEFLFLERTTAPSEDEQVAAYERVVRAFSPHPVTIRLLDVGGDKPIPYLPIGKEANPFLGVRALRLAWSDPQLFVTQLRACYRAAAAGPVKVMAPMVADVGDVDLLMELAGRARHELAESGSEFGDIALGVMLEIPASILVAPSYFGRIAFASLGTNDLLQYTLAADRGNAGLERYRDPLHPALLRLIGQALDESRRAGIELSICGEMAGDPAAALALVGLGLRSLSMAPSSLPAVRRALRGVRIEDLANGAEVALGQASAADVRARFDAQLPADARA